MNAITTTTFSEWAKDFQIRFNWFAEMLADAPLLKKEFDETFRKFSVDVLRKATTELTFMDPQPKTGEVMAKLYARCKSLTMLPVTHSRPVDPNLEPRYKCLACVDSGLLRVYHPKSYQKVKDGNLEFKHIIECVVACTCDEGEKKTQDSKGCGGRVVKGAVQFDPKKFKIINAIGNQDQAAELTEFVLSMKPKFSGFEDYQ